MYRFVCLNSSCRNSLGQVPYLATKDKQVRNEFRRFRAQFPKRYDYTAGCVPAPLSEEREHEKRTKEAERRKALKKAKTARLKVSSDFKVSLTSSLPSDLEMYTVTIISHTKAYTRSVIAEKENVSCIISFCVVFWPVTKLLFA